jgi:hypothetical protein
MESIIELAGHLLGTAVIFGAFVAVGWAVSLFLQFLHGVHPFPPKILSFITTFELYLVYGDSVLCVFVLLDGAICFIKEVWERRK